MLLPNGRSIELRLPCTMLASNLREHTQANASCTSACKNMFSSFAYNLRSASYYDEGEEIFNGLSHILCGGMGLSYMGTSHWLSARKFHAHGSLLYSSR